MGSVAKTLNYMKRNGLIKTVYAVKERVDEKKTLSYAYTDISEEERLRQLEDALNYKASFSILTPAYETDEKYLRAMIDSVIAQTYTRWELVIADASSSDIVKDTVRSYEDVRIKYVRLKSNAGISENTNEGLKECSNEYIGLLDHDDMLTKDALYEMAKAIDGAGRYNIKLQVLYSDEDKTNGDGSTFFEVNTKPAFNLDLLMSNNYICHFMVMKSELIKDLRFRKKLDGAQDHDLLLRAAGRMINEHGRDYTQFFYHVDKVLYHWRAHEGSTAQNPKSKAYAYNAGRIAVSDFVKSQFNNGDKIKVYHSENLGFFKVVYDPDIFTCRKDVCAVGGRMIDKKKKVIGGAYDENKELLFKGLSVHNSGGYLHRAACMMEVPYLDYRCMVFDPEDKSGLSAVKLLNELKDENEKSEKPLSDEELSFRFCDIIRERGGRIIYDPSKIVKVR